MRYFKKKKIFNLINSEYDNFFCGFGKCEIKNEIIIISDYKFKPSIAYPQIILNKEQIVSITLDSNPPQIKYKEEWIFISSEYKDKLKEFVERNDILKSDKNWTWDNILDPFLDTDFTKEEQEKTLRELEKYGIDRNETREIRDNVSKQMYKYNFDTMLWNWYSLGLSDVLQAMRVKYSEEEFKSFYKYAMAIENKTTYKNRA